MTPITATTHYLKLEFTTEVSEQAQTVRAYSRYAAPIRRPLGSHRIPIADHYAIATEYAEVLGVDWDSLLTVYPVAFAQSLTPGDDRMLWVRAISYDDEEETDDAK